MKYKVIFLDIDGVLNLRNRTRDKFGSIFHAKWVANLKRITDATNAKIVISSTWRHDGLETMQAMWKKRNLPSGVIDITPHLYSKDFSVPRGCEIEMWLKDKKFQRINWCKATQLEYLEKTEIENYIILDDDSDMLYKQKEHFIKTSNQHNCKDAKEGYGLTLTASDKAIEILNTPIVELYYGKN